MSLVQLDCGQCDTHDVAPVVVVILAVVMLAVVVLVVVVLAVIVLAWSMATQCSPNAHELLTHGSAHNTAPYSPLYTHTGLRRGAGGFGGFNPHFAHTEKFSL